VAVLNDIEYFDDSKGTNVGATVAAINSLGAERKLVVILGGDGKGQDFSPLGDPLKRHARAVVLIGRDAALLSDALRAYEIQTSHAKDMAEAVKAAYQLAMDRTACQQTSALATQFASRHQGAVARCLALMKPLL
jgi:UDP-N-acetylmuramoylalanine--D-glutamate ligase